MMPDFKARAFCLAAAYKSIQNISKIEIECSDFKGQNYVFGPYLKYIFGLS